MRYVYAKPLDQNVSALGFGCASLGSRISTAAGSRAIAQAIELGVTWFDVAPSYGDGQAEALLGRALREHRSQVVICTKFGIPRPDISLTKRLLRPLARQVVARFPGIRGTVSRAHALNPRKPMDASDLEPSVTTSLRMLNTEYIDVLALHEPTPEEAVDAEIHEALQRLIDKGLIRSVSVAGQPASICAAANAYRLDFGQFPDNPFSQAAPELQQSLPLAIRPTFVTHGVFGSGVADKLNALPPTLTDTLRSTMSRHGLPPDADTSDLLLAFALSNNPDGVVITSMFDSRHIARNCHVALKAWPAALTSDVRNITAHCVTS